MLVKFILLIVLHSVTHSNALVCYQSLGVSILNIVSDNSYATCITVSANCSIQLNNVINTITNEYTTPCSSADINNSLIISGFIALPQNCATAYSVLNNTGYNAFNFVCCSTDLCNFPFGNYTIMNTPVRRESYQITFRLHPLPQLLILQIQF